MCVIGETATRYLYRNRAGTAFVSKSSSIHLAPCTGARTIKSAKRWLKDATSSRGEQERPRSKPCEARTRVGHAPITANEPRDSGRASKRQQHLPLPSAGWEVLDEQGNKVAYVPIGKRSS
jgi:hypothetical protein